jgi:hypothetical protein
MNASFLKGAFVGLACGLVGGAAVALAGSGVGGVFNLGVSNSVDAKSTLTGASPGIQLQVTNTSAAAGTSGLAVNSASGATTSVFTNAGGGPAGGFFVNAGVKPFTVNSQTKVGNLNADLLDGLDSPALQKRVTGTCAAGSAVRVVNANGGVTCQSVGGGSGPSVLAGVVTFVDPFDASGFIGMGGEANLTLSAADAGSPIPAAGTLSLFRARLTSAAAGNVVFTVFVNGAPTAVSCTIAAAQTTCADGADTVALGAGDTIAVGVTNGSGLLRHVRWSARLGA